MKELLIISGKGGTGKTSVASSFIALAESCIICDYDVDASNLPILLKPEILNHTPFSGGFTAEINPEKCISCGLCQDLCRFEAIDEKYHVDGLSCEGCAFCSRVCPVGAIKMLPHNSGQSFEAITTDQKPIFFAELKPGEENSGKLVAQVKSRAQAKAKEEHIDLIISDGPPGIACSAISSLVGVELALIVAEPSVSAFSDVQRVFELLRLRGVKTALLINKSDLNLALSVDMEEWANSHSIHFIGKIPFSLAVADAIAGATIPVNIPEVRNLFIPLWDKVQGCLNGI
ncbi:MAG: 4Fe-4S binding protein [Syntrophomonadaceae bacterium]|jgi:MinD superfamily P-loop ATPase|nr:4Fe-4S binding protein [Syntrophomonadaceae bacterium]